MRAHNRTHFVLPKTGSIKSDHAHAMLNAIYQHVVTLPDGRRRYKTDDGMMIVARFAKSGKTILDVYDIQIGSTDYEQFVATFDNWRAESMERSDAESKPKPKKYRKRRRYIRGCGALPDRSHA